MIRASIETLFYTGCVVSHYVLGLHFLLCMCLGMGLGRLVYLL